MKMLTPNDPETRSPDLVAENLAKLKALFPELVTEGPGGAAINVDVLKALVGDKTVTDADEKYGLNWHGKRRARQLALTPSTGTLRPCPEESVDWDTTQNLMIEGDNLEVLKLLQKSYAGKVKMIYIDPPYNTGKEFIYPDKYQENLDTYLRYTGQKDDEGFWTSSNPESSGRYHTNWLNMMYPRLRLAKNLLKQDGVIFISIDDHEQANLKSLCDEVFGIENFISCVSVINNMKGRNDRANIATAHEYLLIYSRCDFESYGIPLTEDQMKEYKYEDEEGQKYALRDLRKRGRPDRRQDRPNMFFPIFYNATTEKCSLERVSDQQIEIVPKRGDMSDGRWRWGYDTVAANLDILHPKWSNAKDRWDIQHRVYLNPSVRSEPSDEESDDDDNVARTSKPKSFWWGGEISTDVASREFKKLFPGLNPDYPKSVFFIEKLIQMGTKPGDLILDFFGGFGTTGHSVYRLEQDSPGRRFIIVQLPEKLNEDSSEQKETFNYCVSNGIRPVISDICLERLRRSSNSIKENNTDWKGDLGFRVFKLDSTNIREWDPKRDELQESLFSAIEHLKTDRTEADILYELLLKLGLDLCVPIETRKVAGKDVHSIGGGVLMTCLAQKITRDDVETLGQGIVEWRKALAPASKTTCVFRDSAFADDVAKTNLTEILKQSGIANVRSL